MPHPPAAPARVLVIGTTGSGKSTLARQLAAILDAAYIELDALHWEPNWTEAETGVFRARVAEAMAPPRWVIDGNYTGKLGFSTYDAADTVVWLDYSFARVFWRLFTRTLRRRFRREELWNGNRERLRTHLFTRESLFLWAIQTHWKHRRVYPERLAQPAFAHLSLARLRSPCETQRYVEALTRARAAPEK